VLSTIQKWLMHILPGGIRARLYLLIILAVLPLLLLQFWVYEQRYEIQRTNELQTELEVSRGVAASFSAYLQAVFQQDYAIGTAIITEPSFNQNQATYLLTHAASHFPVIRNLSWVNPQGNVLASSQPNLVDVNLSQRSYFPPILAGQSTAIGNLTQTGAVTNAPTLAVATALRDDHDRLLGVVVAAIETTRLGELTLSQVRPNEGVYTVFDRQGTVVYNSSPDPLSWEERINWKNKDSLLQGVLRTGQEMMDITSLPISGGDWVDARVPILGTGFVAGARRPVSVVFDPLINELVRDTSITLAVGLLALVLAYLVARTISNSIYRLERDAKLMGAGAVKKDKDLYGPKEVRRLRDTVEVMAADLLKRAEIIKESEERYRVLFQNPHTPMLVIDPETDAIIEANPAASIYYGWEVDELVKKKITEINLLPPDQTHQGMKLARSILAGQTLFSQHRLANNDIRDVEIHTGPIEIHGNTYLFSIIHDITDRKQLEADRDQLIAQLDEERARWQGVVEGIAEEVWVCDSQGKISLINLPDRTTMGLEEFKDWPIEKVNEEIETFNLTGEIRPVDQTPLLRSLRGEIVRGEEIMRYRRSGKTRNRQFSSAPIRDASGEITGAVAIVRDVTEYRQLEESLRQNEAQLRTIFEAMSDAVVVFDKDGKVTQANSSAQDAYGFNPSGSQWGEAVQKMSIAYLDGTPVHEEDLFNARVMRGQKVLGERFLLSNPSGRQFTVLASASPLFNENMEFQGAVVVWHDITELEQVQNSLAVNRQRLEDILESIQDGFMEINREWRFTYLNQRVAQNSGIAIEDLVGKNLWETYPAMLGSKLETFYRQVMEQRQPDRMESVGVLTKAWYEIRAYPSNEGITVFWTDITERIETEQALREAHQRAEWLARFPDENPSPVMRVSVDGVVLYRNPATEITGWACEDGEGLQDALLELVKEAMVQGKEVQKDLEMVGRIFSISVMPFPSENYVNIYGRDITERRQAEELLRSSEERFNKAFNSSPNAQVISRIEDGLILEINDSFVQMFGYEREESIGKTSQELNMFANLSDRQEAIRRLREAKMIRNFDLDIQTKTGEIRQASLSVEIFTTGSGSQMLTIIQDITEQKQAEAALRLSETRLRRLFDTSVIGIMNRDIDGTIINANQALLKMLGYTQADIETKKLHINDLIPEEYLSVEQQIQQEVLKAGISKPYEKELIRKDGSQVPVLVGHTRLEGIQVEIIGFVIDLTELKKAQAALEEYTEKLKRSNQDLEQFAFVASHDLQEPLRKILFFGESINHKMIGLVDAETHDHLKRMQNAAERMQRMIRDLLELSRVSTRGEVFSEVDLSQVAEDVIGDLEGRIRKENGQVMVSSLPVIEADRDQMQHLFQNLIGNALKYHRPDIPPVVKISSRVNSSNGEYGPSITLTIEDNGIGFDEQYAERIFQPFQRLHGRGEYEGTGIGLAICQKIVDRHKGKITATSHEGVGSTFLVQLPIRQSDK
jgi:PAS domain S-box-containing protein